MNVVSQEDGYGPRPLTSKHIRDTRRLDTNAYQSQSIPSRNHVSSSSSSSSESEDCSSSHASSSCLSNGNVAESRIVSLERSSELPEASSIDDLLAPAAAASSSSSHWIAPSPVIFRNTKKRRRSSTSSVHQLKNKNHSETRIFEVEIVGASTDNAMKVSLPSWRRTPTFPKLRRVARKTQKESRTMCNLIPVTFVSDEKKLSWRWRRRTFLPYHLTRQQCAAKMEQHQKVSTALDQFATHSTVCDEDEPLYLLYSWLRKRLSVGMVFTSIDFLHKMLKDLYKEATQLLLALQETVIGKEMHLLIRLRHRLAGTWCIYTQFLFDCSLVNLEHVGGSRFQSLCDLAMTTLEAIKKCPLVKNHQFVALSIARLTVSRVCWARKIRNAKVTREHLSVALKSASTSCWEALEKCHDHNKEEEHIPSKLGRPVIQNRWRPYICSSDEEGVDSKAVLRFTGKVLDLPRKLSEELESGKRAIEDNNTARKITEDLNHLSRLSERIHENVGLELKFPGPGNTLLDALPLFASYDLFATNGLGFKCTNVYFPEQGFL